MTVELPLWLFLLIVAFAGVTFASHFLFPSVRWFFRRRMERAVVELNKRLARPIQPFKLARRYDTIQRLIYDREVLEAVAEHAAAENVPEAVAHQRAARYAREIVPAFSAFTYFGFAIRAARWLSELLYDVKVTQVHEGIDRIDPDATVVFVMNHRSNMDYVLVTYLVAERTALSYAVGEWARVWPLSRLIRSMGAYFIRRKSRNALYRKVLARYVAIATAAGVTQAVFPEGGLSLDGHVQQPKLGILSYILDGFDPARRDVVFVPVALNYDRVLEDRILTDAARARERRFRASLPAIAGFFFRNVWRRLRGRYRRFGVAAVGFGEPLSLRDYIAQVPEQTAERLGMQLMALVAAAVPPLPVPLVARALVRAGRPLSRAEIVVAVAPAVAQAEAAVEQGLGILLGRHLVTEADGAVSIVEEDSDLLHFYAASVLHLDDAVAAGPAEDAASAKS